VCISRVQFHAVHIALFVIEFCFDDGGAELAGVDLILGFFVITVEPDAEIRTDVLGDAGIEVVATFRPDRIIAGARELACGIIGGRDIARVDGLEGGRGEILRVAGVEGGAARGLEGQIEARAELILMGELVNNIVTRAIIESQCGGDFPFVLEIARLRGFAGFAMRKSLIFNARS